MKKYQRWLLYACYFVLAIGVFFIRPVYDDWFSAAYPRFDFQLSDLLPSGAFWRPIENGLGGLLASVPTWFPVFNHLLVVVLFSLTAWIARRILRICSVNAVIREVAFFVILLSPAGMATLFSIDAINQAGAAFFGMLSIYAYLRYVGSRRYLYWLLSAVVAVFFKESGIAYFVVAPLVAFAMSKPDWKSLVNGKSVKMWVLPVLSGILLAGIYFGVRLALSDGRMPFNENASSNYAMHLCVVNILKNLGLLLGSVSTTIDTIALFCTPRNPAIVILSFLCGIPLLLLILRSLVKVFCQNEFLLKYLVLAVAIFCVAAPHLLMHHCGEMHAYSILPLFVIVAASLFGDCGVGGKYIGLSLSLYFLAAVGVDFHKYACMYRCGMLGEIIVEQIDEKSENTPANVLILEVEDIDSKGYSVFCSSAADSFFRGQYYRWKHRFASPEEIYYESLPSVPSQQEIMQFVDAYRVHSIDCVWVIDGTNVAVIEL